MKISAQKRKEKHVEAWSVKWDGYFSQGIEDSITERGKDMAIPEIPSKGFYI